MSRPGWLVHAEHEARDDYERNHWDTPPNRDEPPPERTTERVPEVDRAIARYEAEQERRRRG